MSLFKQKSKGMNDQQLIATLISEGCIIEGNIKAPNFVRIDGHIKGDINVEEGMILGENGIVNGNVYTKEMIVYGTINGNLRVESLKIQSSGKINGEIQTQTLQVEMGAVYNGKISTNTTTASVNTNHSIPGKHTAVNVKELVESI